MAVFRGTGIGISVKVLKRFRDPESPTYDAAFAARCEAAREDGFLKACEHVARSKDWRASRWRLEVGLPELFARRTIVAGDAGNPVRIEIAAALVASARIRSSRSLLGAR